MGKRRRVITGDGGLLVFVLFLVNEKEILGVGIQEGETLELRVGRGEGGFPGRGGGGGRRGRGRHQMLWLNLLLLLVLVPILSCVYGESMNMHA
jgi:hypothetical protein